ncbi:hypothetical protein GOY14_02570 [Wolbachia endosymbiont of Dipetalonema caudispina]|uniref:ankyrin repeat domain-containing protein n=1 Tax=Wolbachia endosymbiont of Dipetalonema caudispina TaxID=1812112 RepID=UPI0015890290|nr:ankyrin repeat domain-containing protein [Wolbachia endosymbiont of Dipetalonema caudispina]QKX01200.1 hypothetical protein GOY14_02570 [Wolbachia endosymbiont of Dipetalonema caudispina]
MRSFYAYIVVYLIFNLISLFAIGQQLKERKIDVDKLVSCFIPESIGIEENLKQGLLQSMIQQMNDLEFFKNAVDILSVEKMQDLKIRREEENEEELQYGKDKGLFNLSSKNLSKGSKNEVTSNLPSLIGEEMNKSLIFPLSTNLGENATDLQQKDLQIYEGINVEKDEFSKSDADKLLEKKKLYEQIKKEEVKKLAKSRNIEKLFAAKKDERSVRDGEKNPQKWKKLSSESVNEWRYKNVQNESIYRRQYDNLNEHLPVTMFIADYSKQLFFCIRKNNLICLRGIMGELEKLGLTVQEMLKFRNRFGDTPLIYAVKKGEIDVVRFFLLQGADPEVTNDNLQSPIDIAIKRTRVDMVNAIAEMIPYFLEYKRINNKEDLEMYNWALKMKKDNRFHCGEKDN